MKIFFLFCGSNQSKTISLLEECSDLFSDLVFSLGGRRSPRIVSEGLFKILRKSHRVVFGVNQLEGKISEQPKERWKSVEKFLSVILILPLKDVGQLKDKMEVFHCLLIDAASAVEDEIGGEEQCQQKYLDIGALSLLERAKSLGVDDEAVLVAQLDKFRPDPKSLGACVDGVPNAKPIAPVEKDPVEDVALACSVFAGNRNNVEGVSFECL